MWNFETIFNIGLILLNLFVVVYFSVVTHNSPISYHPDYKKLKYKSKNKWKYAIVIAWLPCILYKFVMSLAIDHDYGVLQNIVWFVLMVQAVFVIYLHFLLKDIRDMPQKLAYAIALVVIFTDCLWIMAITAKKSKHKEKHR